LPSSNDHNQSDRYNLAEAEKFLQFIGQGEDKLTFQTFSDVKGRPHLTRVLHGTFDQHKAQLMELSQAGAGVFVTVNKTNLKGRKSADIIAVRFVFVDLDGTPKENLDRFPLKPHAQIETSPGKYHAYYRVSGMPLEAFKATQACLSTLIESDPKVNDIARVMRIAGFPHQKEIAAPYLTKILTLDDEPAFPYETFSNEVKKFVPEKTQEKKPKPGKKTHQQPKEVGINGSDPLEEEKKLRSALKMIPADDELIWREVGMALKNSIKIFGELRCLMIFDEWSQKSPTKYNEGQNLIRWKSFDIDHQNGKTLRTIYAYASERGWRWLGQVYENPEDAFLLEEMNQQYACVMIGGKHAIMNEKSHPITKNLTRTFSKVFDFKAMLQNKRIYRSGKEITKANWWLNHPNRRQYDGVIFDPSNTSSATYYNLYKGFAVSPRSGDCNLFLDHIKMVICSNDDTLYHYVIRWMADAVQHPSRKPGVALVLIGQEGTGKGVFVSNFGKLFGSHFLHLTNFTPLIQNFNGFMDEALVIFCDEANWNNDSRAASILKALITEPTTMIERKGFDAEHMRNYSRFIIASNDARVVPIGSDSRRFFVLEVANSRRQDFEYFSMMQNQMDGGGLEALLEYLLTFDLKNFEVKKFPQTRGLQNQLIESFTGVAEWWFSCLQCGIVIDDKWPQEALSLNIYAAYRAYVVPTNKAILSDANFFKELIKVAGSAIRRVRLREGEVRPWGYSFVSLQKAREEFNTINSSDFPWPDFAVMQDVSAGEDQQTLGASSPI
jgi:hypothetical protein